MTVKQISVFLENKPGRLYELTKVLRENQIDMRALSIAETPDFGILRLIVDDSYKTACVLKDAGYICYITPVLAAEVADEAGGLEKILEILGENDINLEYTYAFITRKKGTAYMVFRVQDNDRAIEILSQNHVHLICQDAFSDL